MRLCLTILVCVALLVQSSFQEQSDKDGQEYPSLKNPIRTAAEDEIKNLPGLNQAVSFKQFSGYLSGSAGPKVSKFMHYWFVESQSDPANDPVVLWLNGGPGCSSLGGLFTELGPFTVDTDGKTLKLNNFSWNKVANVLFLESPTGVGFSYASNLISIHTDDTTARENHRALKSFMQKFPQYKKNPLYLSGESYAGVYLPTLGVLVDADPELNLKGVAIGNGYLDVAKLSESLIFFSYAHGLTGKTTWDKISKHCCGGHPPERGVCDFTSSKRSIACRLAVNDVSSTMNSGINPYNLYAPCYNTGAPSSRDVVDRAMMSLYNGSVDYSNATNSFHRLDLPHMKGLGVEPPCFDDRSLINYLNTPEVREAIHIPKGVSAWDTCATFFAYVMQYPKLPGGLSPQMKSLIDSKRNLTMLVYNGDVDGVCNFLGDEWFVDDLGRKVISDYRMWHLNKQVAGFVKHYDGISFATVRGSGHMVPGDRPAEALKMIKTFLSSKCQNVYL